MDSPDYRLETVWTPDDRGNGSLGFALFNLTDKPLAGFVLAYTSLTRADAQAQVDNAEIVRQLANLHELAPPADLVVEPGGAWRFAVRSLTRKARHRTDGVGSAYLALADGSVADVAFGDLMLGEGTPTRPARLIPEGRIDVPLAILPWPASVSATDFAGAPVGLHPAPGSPHEALVAVTEAAALAGRLFPNTPPPFTLEPGGKTRPLRFSHRDDGEASSYSLSFTHHSVELEAGSGEGLRHGLITLAHMLRGAHTEPDRFAFPGGGGIEDAPRHGWRGCHLDVSRQMYPLADVRRFVDILAWCKMNVLHWHLTDDEGWRIEIEAYPELTDIGARRGPGEKLAAQLGTGARPTAGFYSRAEIRELVAHAARLGVEVLPEIDTPGHCTAALAALPHLVDPGEPANSYFSIQGYPNNALNPGMPETYEFLERVYAEVAAMFPSGYIHVGGDEVPDGAWMQSPLARAAMAKEGLANTAELQSYFMRRSQSILAGLGKGLAGWDEVADGGGIDPDNALLMVWRKSGVGLELARAGYDVIMCPGDAYYLDMVQADDWLEPGMSWAGTVPPERAYSFESVANVPPELVERFKGVQGCIWSENLTSRDRFNHMVFPRLGAVAEAGWTESLAKDWQRFSAQSRLLPRL